MPEIRGTYAGRVHSSTRWGAKCERVRIAHPEIWAHMEPRDALEPPRIIPGRHRAWMPWEEWEIDIFLKWRRNRLKVGIEELSLMLMRPVSQIDGFDPFGTEGCWSGSFDRMDY